MKVGSLFSGYEGLGMSVQSVLGGELAWVSDIDPGACKILAHRYPDVPNIGDITKVDWADVEPVDVLTGGFPCQDVSAAGKRAGIRPGTRSGLWAHFAHAITQLKPRLVVVENVRGLLSASAHSDLEPCPWCLGDRPDGHLRALGAVLGDLASLGFDAEWVGLRAADVGAPHGRFRVFIAAYPRGEHGLERWLAAPGQAESGRPLGEPAGRSGALLPTPRTGDGTKGGPNQRGSSGDLMLPSAVQMLPTPQARDCKGYGPADGERHDPNLSAVPLLLPTPAVNDMGEGKTVDAWDEWTAKMKAAHGNGNGHGLSLACMYCNTHFPGETCSNHAGRLLPTPNAGDAKQGYVSAEDHSARAERKRAENPNLGDLQADLPQVATTAQDWGDYAAAIARWEHVTRPAPAPTETGPKGNPRLSARFSEWLMGVPDGWITDVPSIARNEALKACGNGVVPKQAEAALRVLLARAGSGVAA